MTDNKKISFIAELRPNRSLTPRAFLIVMSFVSLVSFVAGIFFMQMGAWPVFGFFGLDVVLLYWAFKSNFAQCEKSERVEITDSELIVFQNFRNKPRLEHHFIKNWVRIDLAEDKAREIVGQLTVRSHAKTLVIASFLGSDERKEFYAALKTALINKRFA